MNKISDFLLYLPKRIKTSHKKSVGGVVVVGGFKDYKGAGILCAKAALRTGSGYTRLMTSHANELFHFPWHQHPDLILEKASISLLKRHLLEKNNCVVIGPGLGKSKLAKNLLLSLINFSMNRENNEHDQLLVLDADALNLLSTMPKPLKNNKFSNNVVFTPHEGEISRLLKVDVTLVQKNRELMIKKAQSLYGGVWILKGFQTLVFDGMNLFKINNGQPALAKAGSGDVLAGMIAAFMAQGVGSFKASVLACFIHNQCALEFLRKNDEISLSPLDLIELLPKIIKKMRSKSIKL